MDLGARVGLAVLAVAVDPERDHVRGGGAAGAVTLVEYGDYECPYSRAAYRSVEVVERRLGDRLRFVYRQFPLREIHAHAQAAAEAAEGAAAQERFWPMHDALFLHQHALTGKDLRRYAADLELDLGVFDAALRDGRVRARIDEDIDGGNRAGVNGTPALFIDGARYDGSYAVDDLERALASAGVSA